MFNFIKKQFIDIIQWENPDEETLVWRFPIADQELQNGASLTVREAQMAMFVDEGRT
ncbi:MAG: SPFH domain-containing protein, partial [Neisseria elongata]